MDEEAKKWLAEHAHELDPEEIVFEEEKINAAFRTWPVAEEVFNMGIYAEIDSPHAFHRIVGDPDNWREILSREDLFENWILPHAVLFFTKNWFDKTKWNPHIGRGIPFPLFSDDDKSICRNTSRSLDDLPSGRAKIAHIIEKTAYALKVYLRGDFWYKKGITKPVGPYIIEAVKNSFTKEIAADYGYKSKNTPACPYCLSQSQKTVLTKQMSNKYSCHRCTDLAANLKLRVINLGKNGENEETSATMAQYNRVAAFENFHNVTCICPSNNCSGKFVPLTCIDQDIMSHKHRETKVIHTVLDQISGVNGTHIFKEPTGILKRLPLICPFCDTRFTPAVAMRFESGFKNKSGYFTGLPTICIWKQSEEIILDSEEQETDITLKDKLAAPTINLDNQIFIKQRVKIISEELILYMSSIGKDRASDLATWYFYAAVVKWINKYWLDAFRYFFGSKMRERDMTSKEMLRYPGQTKKKMTDTLRGREMSIHQSIFQIWQDLLEQNIDEFTILDSSITSLKDFWWLCRPPKFSGGPKSIFRVRVGSNKRITNDSKIVPINPKHHAPRLARVLSIYKVDNKNVVDYNINYINDIRLYEWQAICLDANSKLEPGDKVRVEVLVMSGHPTHAPIQRILRLRTKILAHIINRLSKEERLGNRDARFWDNRKIMFDKAKESFDILKLLGD